MLNSARVASPPAKILPVRVIAITVKLKNIIEKIIPRIYVVKTIPKVYPTRIPFAANTPRIARKVMVLIITSGIIADSTIWRYMSLRLIAIE